MTMATLRRWHSYIGMLIAPSVLFFALTGILQLFSLHESHGAYDPPAIIEKLSSVHKDQVFAFGGHHRAAPAANAPRPAAPPPADDDGDALSTVLLKVFFLVVGIGLAASTILGIWIGLTRPAGRRIGWGLLLAGAVIPVGLLLI